MRYDESMKPRIAAALFALLLALAVFAPAHEKHAKKAAGGEQTLVAEVIDTSCYLQHGNSTGEAHRQCALDCANQGVPLALLTSSGAIYLPLSMTHKEPYNKPLLPYAGKKVRVKGRVLNKGGLRGIEIKSIEPL